MKNFLYTPISNEIRQIISCIGYVEMSDTDHDEGWFGIVPNGTSNLTISLNEEESVHYHNNQGKSLLFASWNSPVAIKRDK